jgi:hypothetical protein
MPQIAIQLTFDNMNISVQVGDIVYYTYGGQLQGGFDYQETLQNTKKLGEIIQITGNQIVVLYDDQLTSPPPLGSYISFVKNKKVNTSSLLGYYMSANFVNNSKKKIELFSVGSEITESSK